MSVFRAFIRRALLWRSVPPLQHGRLSYRGIDNSIAGRGRLAGAGILLVAVFVIGTAGYVALGDGRWSVEDSAYMVLITITAVGYGEVLPVADVAGGRAFTMALLVSGMGVSLYFLSALTAFIIEGDLREALWRRKMEKRLSDLRGHVVVCGAGRTGAYVTEDLIHAGADVVVVELNRDRLDALVKKYGDRVFGIEGDATDDGVLTDAGVERANGLITALQKDQDNLYVALSARAINSKLRIVARANAERAGPKLRQAGADVVISPTHIGGRRMAQELLRPNVVGFLDFISRDVERNLDIEEIPIPKNSPLDGVKLMDSKIREVSSALVLAAIAEDKHLYNPPPDLELAHGMTLIVLGEGDQIAKLNRYLND